MQMASASPFRCLSSVLLLAACVLILPVRSVLGQFVLQGGVEKGAIEVYPHVTGARAGCLSPQGLFVSPPQPSGPCPESFTVGSPSTIPVKLQDIHVKFTMLTFMSADQAPGRKGDRQYLIQPIGTNKFCGYAQEKPGKDRIGGLVVDCTQEYRHGAAMAVGAPPAVSFVITCHAMRFDTLSG